MRNKIFITALLLVIPFFVTACTLADLPGIGKFFKSNTDMTKKTATITVWGLWESPETMDKVIKKYQETHPNITINYDDRSVIKPNQYKETVEARAGQKDAPDILLVHNTWVSRLKDKLTPAPSGVLPVDTYKNTYYAPAFNSAVIDGKVYATPVYYDGLALVYNKKHFQAIDQTNAPTAWEEFRALAKRLSITNDDGELIRAGAALGTVNNIEFSTDIIGMLLAQTNVTIPDKLDSRAAQDAITFYTYFSKVDGVWNDKFPEVSTAFAQEKVSMIFVPSWNLLDIVRMRPDLEIGVAPVPQAMVESPASWSSFWMYAVPSGSNNKDVAWDFVKYLASEEAELLKVSESAQSRTFGAPYANKNLSKISNVGVLNLYVKPYLDTAEFGRYSLFASRSGNDVQVNALKKAVNSVLYDKNPSLPDLLKEVKQSY